MIDESAIIFSVLFVILVFVFLGVVKYKTYNNQEVDDTKTVHATAESLRQLADDTNTVNGGISEDLYNKIVQHNSEAASEISRTREYAEAAGYSDTYINECIIDISKYTVLYNTTECTTTEIDSQYYKLVPLS